MKRILLTFFLISTLFNASAQYRDSLKVFRKLTKKCEKSSDFVLIPSGAYVRGSNDSDIPTPDLNGYYFRNHVVTIDSFFMQKFEVSNKQYLEFVNAMLEEDSVLGKTFLPDTLVWRDRLANNEPYIEYYLRHPAYQNYPVVGISYNQVKAYAEWITKNYNANPERVFKEVKFRLPTEEEWEFASKGESRYSYLPWGHNATISPKGEAYANFKIVSQLGVYRDSVLVEYLGEIKKRPVYLSTGASMMAGSSEFYNSDVTVPVNSFYPNPFGLYNMAGNVEELVDAFYLREPKLYEFMSSESVKSDTPWGITKGGSWNDTGYYLQYPVRQFYETPDDASREIGFRLVMEVVNY